MNSTIDKPCWNWIGLIAMAGLLGDEEIVRGDHLKSCDFGLRVGANQVTLWADDVTEV